MLFFQIFEKMLLIFATGLLRSGKLVHSSAKNVLYITQNLMRNLVILVPASQNKRKWLKK